MPTLKPDILVAQSFIVAPAGSYWDYRDYIFCLCSNLSLTKSAIRLNLEKGQEFAPEFVVAAAARGFSDFFIGTEKPKSWAGFMLDQIRQCPAAWVMPWPGDHIYVHAEQQAFTRALAKAESLGADAVAYSHVQDFEYILDWPSLQVLYNDQEYVLVRWGHKYKYHLNPKLQAAAQKILGNGLLMAPVPGFAVYRSNFFTKILEALPPDTKRWQDMEYSTAAQAWSFKLLIPKRCLYRHVHGYWLEGFLKFWQTGRQFPKEDLDRDSEIKSWYIKTNFDPSQDLPTRQRYLTKCLEKYPYFSRFCQERQPGSFINEFGRSPFDADWPAEYPTTPLNNWGRRVYRRTKAAASFLKRRYKHNRIT